jgi:uncharacterized protein (TIGR03086 family)
MHEVALLEGILTKTGNIIAGVRPDQRERVTPCPEFDVEALMNHIVGWIQVFDAGCNGRVFAGDPATYRCGPDAAHAFRASAASLIAGWEEHGLDRPVRVTSGEMPGEMVFNMTVMEYFGHGWDLAVATGQPIPYTEQEAIETLARAEATLPAEYRGDSMPFGPIIPVNPDASSVDKLVAFLGRNPEAPGTRPVLDGRSQPKESQAH